MMRSTRRTFRIIPISKTNHQRDLMHLVYHNDDASCVWFFDICTDIFIKPPRRLNKLSRLFRRCMHPTNDASEFVQIYIKQLRGLSVIYYLDYLDVAPNVRNDIRVKQLRGLYTLSISFWRCALCTTITKTCLYNFDPLKPHIYIVKLGFTEVYFIFLISAQNIDCGYSLEPPRRGGSNEYPQSMFLAEIWKI